MADEAWRAVLGHEFGARPGSFLDTLRTDWRWDQATFGRVTEAMVLCCRALDKAEAFDRWLAEGFWYVSRWPREFTSHDGWSGEKDLIDEGVQVLDELAYWFFTREPVAGGIGDR